MNNARKYGGGVCVGILAGITHGLCGWGGAQVIKPALISGLGITTLASNGISLTSLACASSTAAFKFTTSDCTNLKIAAAIALPSVVGARIGVRLAQKLPNDVLSLIFNGMSVLFIPMHFLVQQYRDRQPLNGDKEHNCERNEGNYALMQHAAFGTSMGIISSLMGVGGAPLTMSYLTMATDLHHHEVQGTMMVAVMPAVVTSAVSLLLAGHIPLLLALAVCCGSISGSAIGAEIALKLSEKQLRDCYMASLVILGGRSVFGAIGNISKLRKSHINVQNMKKK